MRLRYIILLFICLPLSVFAQHTYLEVNGFVETRIGRMLPYVTVDVYSDGAKINSVRSDQKGYFTIHLDYGKDYRLVFVKKGMIEKRIDFKTNIPKEKWGKLYNNFGMTLVEDCEGAVTDVFKEPVDIIRYKDDIGNFDSDQSYVGNIQSRLNAAYASIDKCKRETFENNKADADEALKQGNFDEAEELYKEALKINPEDAYSKRQLGQVRKAREKQEVNQARYERLMKEGGQYLAKNSLSAAKQRYSDALKLRPSDTKAREQLNEIDQILAQQQATQQKQTALDNKYNQILADANQAMATQNYPQAKQLYEEAIALKPNETFPTQKLAQAQQSIKKQEQQKAQHEQINKSYNDALAAGQSALQKGNFTDAQKHFRAAQMVKPKGQEAQSMLAEVKKQEAAKKKADQQAHRQEQERLYNEAIQNADGLLSQKEYDNAIVAYQEALKYKSSDQYALVNIKKAKNLKVKEEQAKQAEVENAFDNAIAQGNLLKNNGKFNEAIESYKQALQIKPGSQKAKSKLGEAEDLLADQKLRAKEENETRANYNQLVQEGDSYLRAQDYLKARDSFREASLIYSNEDYPKNKIAEIDNILEKQKIREEYNDLVAEADQLFNQQNWEKAIAKYNKAQALQPQERYPQNKINEISKVKGDIAKSQKQAEYDKVAAEAEQLIANKQFEDARLMYQKAQNILPDNSYPRTRINEINEMISQREKNAVEDKYNELVQDAETLIANKEYEQAISILKKAKLVIPTQSFPQKRINEVNALIAQREKNKAQSRYDEIAQKAEEQVVQKNYDKAKALYQQAAGVLPDNPYPAQRINEINAMVANAAKAKKLEKYNQLIAKADELFDNKQFDEARSVFESAKKENPDSDYPQQRINEINQTVSQLAREEIESKYQKEISAADSYFDSKQYDLAMQAYAKANQVIPEKTYPQQKINEIKGILSDMARAENEKKATQKKYDDAIALADKFYNEKSYISALAEYKKALGVFSGEEYPTNQIVKIESLVAEQERIAAEKRERQKNFANAIAKADELFKARNYSESKTFYANALEIKPADAHAQSQVKRIDLILEKQKAELAKKNKDNERYMSFVKAADARFEGKEYQKAQALYYQALEVKPNEDYPKGQLQKIKQLLALAAVKKNTTSTSGSGSTTEKKLADLKFRNESEREKYMEDLKKNYQPGITIEVYKERNITTKRYIVIRNNKAHEYRVASFSWGGGSYSADGKPSNPMYIREATKPRDGEQVYKKDM